MSLQFSRDNKLNRALSVVVEPASYTLTRGRGRRGYWVVCNQTARTYTILFLLLFSTVPHYHRLFCEVEVHFVVDILALWVEALQDLCQHVDGLLTAQACALGLKFLQQIFGGHGFTDQVAPDRLLC